jgi:type IV secretory pathway TrbD component
MRADYGGGGGKAVLLLAALLQFSICFIFRMWIVDFKFRVWLFSFLKIRYIQLEPFFSIPL